jgi:peptide/nickel transport system permease protein
MGLTVSYVIRRMALFFAVIWLTATLNFVLVHLAPGDPTGAMLAKMQTQGATVPNSAAIITAYRKTFGLDQPLPVQYLKYLAELSRGNMGYSLNNFPARVSDIIAGALPWTIGLVLTATIIAFVLGTLLGALMAWRATPGIAKALLPPLLILAAIPNYLLGILLLYVFAFILRWFPVGGSTSVTTTSGLNLPFILDIVDHSVLPAAAIVLTAIGGWMLGMRAMMITVSGSDYLTLAEVKGLRERRIFLRYALRNAILPQVTGLAIALGYVVSGSILVEVVFSYPGIGNLLAQAITNVDYPLIEGITLILVVAIALAILVLDLLYPRIDPRISYHRR